MSARQYSFTGTTENGTKSITSMHDWHDKGYVSLTFYKDSELTQVASPLGGSIIISVSEDGEIFGSIPNGELDASTIGPNKSYQRPNWGGASTHLRLTFLDIPTSTGYFKCDISRSGGF